MDTTATTGGADGGGQAQPVATDRAGQGNLAGIVAIEEMDPGMMTEEQQLEWALRMSMMHVCVWVCVS